MTLKVGTMRDRYINKKYLKFSKILFGLPCWLRQ